jgi:hypothetical protein
MKKLFTIIACTAALLPLSQVQAKTFGGFAPKKTFTLTVETKASAKATATGGSVVSAVPKGIPNFAEGQLVKFKIGGNGQLIGKGFEIPFKPALTTTAGNTYNNQPKRPTAQSVRKVANALIYKDSAGEPVGAVLIFTKVNGSGLKTSNNLVTYTLEKK